MTKSSVFYCEKDCINLLTVWSLEAAGDIIISSVFLLKGVQMELEALHKNTYSVGYSDVDFTKKLKLSALFGYFQDTASQAAAKLGGGVDTLAEKYSVAWVLLRIRAEIGRFPELNEEITVQTWPHPPGKLEFERDYSVIDAEGKVIIRAVSHWGIIDVEKRELRKSGFIELKYPPFIQEHALEYKFGKLRPFGQPDAAYKKVIGYSDVDFNGHINNARYIDYIMDCFPVESHRQYCVRSIEVNYIKEAFPGDTLVMFRDVSALASNKVYIEGVNEADGKAVFRAQVEIVPKA